MTGILLINLGSPDTTKIPDVKRYLDEFLMDKRVIDYNYIKRLLLIRGIILRTRPPKTAEAYKKIWSNETGSPLIHLSYELMKKMKSISEFPIALGMRYGNPSIENGMKELASKGCNKIIIVPLYPQYAMSSYETVWVKALDVRDKHFKNIELQAIAPFYNHPKYLDAMKTHIQAFLPEEYDHILYSFHGIPERHIRRYQHPTALDTFEQCYHNTNHSHNDICYVHQCYQFAEFISEKMNIPSEKYSFSYQSRLGREKWMDPYTDECLVEYPKKGIKKLVILCPAFVSDCLETLEEINMEGRKEFLENGGEEFTYIPCLNTDDNWIKTLYEIIIEGIEGNYTPNLLMSR